jgi:hypothetical protein
MRSVLSFVGVVGITLAAARADAQPISFSRAAELDVDSSAVVRSQFLPGADDGTGRSPAKQGAIIGSVVGFAAGLYGGIRLSDSFGCKTSLNGQSQSCDRSGDRAAAIVLVTAVGTGAGALAGATIGWIGGFLSRHAPTQRTMITR